MLLQQTSSGLVTALQRARVVTLSTSPSITLPTPTPLSPPSTTSLPSSSANMATVETASPRMPPDPTSPSSHRQDDLRSTRSKPASENPQKGEQRFPSPAFFPLGYKEAAYQWWTSVTPYVAEQRVLSLIPHIKQAGGLLSNAASTTDDTPDPHGSRTWTRSLVKLPGKNRAINELCIEREGEEVDDHLVMLHGYGAGLGLFYRNFEPITRVPGVKAYALDLLGMGNSSRPAFKMRSRTKQDKVIEAENWFVDALEEWRVARKIERFTLLGHSLGGYLAVSYAARYPGHLKKLILVSPVGVPENPFAVDAAMPEPDQSTLANEVTQDQETVVKKDDSVNVRQTGATPNAPTRTMPGWFVWLWDANFSPFSFVRNSGPLGPRFMSAWSSRRFSHLPTEESKALHEYCFSIFRQKGSGEYALGHILAPGAYARRPIIHRIGEVGRHTVENPDGTKVKENGIPIVFMYGDNDWMDVAGGLASEEKLKERKAQALREATEEERRTENGSSKVIVVPKAGHNIFLDNPEDFNKYITEELLQTKKDQAKRVS